jgi:hypothetical protein
VPASDQTIVDLAGEIPDVPCLESKKSAHLCGHTIIESLKRRRYHFHHHTFAGTPGTGRGSISKLTRNSRPSPHAATRSIRRASLLIAFVSSSACSTRNFDVHDRVLPRIKRHLRHSAICNAGKETRSPIVRQLA